MKREKESAWVTLGALGCQLVRGTVSNSLGRWGEEKTLTKGPEIVSIILTNYFHTKHHKTLFGRNSLGQQYWPVYGTRQKLL